MGEKYASLVCALLVLITGSAGAEEAKDPPLPDPALCTQVPPKGINPAHYLWPKDNEDAWHCDYEAYHNRPMNFCHGATKGTKEIIYITPSWNYHSGSKCSREDWNYPIRMINTVAGVLVSRSREYSDPVTINGKILIDSLDMEDQVEFVQTYYEPTGKPQIIIIHYIKSQDWKTDTSVDGYRLLDVGVSPPFITPEILPDIGMYKTAEITKIEKWNTDTFNHSWDEVPNVEPFLIEKSRDGAYIISGDTGKPRLKYDRKTHAITMLK